MIQVIRAPNRGVFEDERLECHRINHANSNCTAHRSPDDLRGRIDHFDEADGICLVPIGDEPARATSRLIPIPHQHRPHGILPHLADRCMTVDPADDAWAPARIDSRLPEQVGGTSALAALMPVDASILEATHALYEIDEPMLVHQRARPYATREIRL